MNLQRRFVLPAFACTMLSLAMALPVLGQTQSQAGSAKSKTPAAPHTDVDTVKPAEPPYVIGDDGQKVYFISKPTPTPADVKPSDKKTKTDQVVNPDPKK